MRPVISAARVGEHSAVEWNWVYRSPVLAMRSKAGVGMTPPNVLGRRKPTSSVMIKSTLGAPLGGTTRGGHQGVDCAAFSLITPPNFGSGGGNCFPSMVVVALGEPGTPVVCWAMQGSAAMIKTNINATGKMSRAQRLGLGRIFISSSHRLNCG